MGHTVLIPLMRLTRKRLMMILRVAMLRARRCQGRRMRTRGRETKESTLRVLNVEADMLGSDQRWLVERRREWTVSEGE